MTGSDFFEALTAQMRAAADGDDMLNAAMDILVHTDDPLAAVEFIARGRGMLCDARYATWKLIDDAYNDPDAASMSGRFDGIQQDGARDGATMCDCPSCGKPIKAAR